MIYWKDHIYTDEQPTMLFKLTWKDGSADGHRWSSDKTYEFTERSSLPKVWMNTEAFYKWWENRSTESVNWTENHLLAYTHPVVGCFLQRIHFDIEEPIMWECSAKVKAVTIDKVAKCTKLTTERIRVIPEISKQARMHFGFACVSKVFKDKVYQDWFLDWMVNRDRSTSRAKEIRTYCNSKISRHQHELSIEEQSALAAQHQAQAAIEYNGEGKAYQRLVEYYTAQAAVEANRVAYQAKIHFDLISIAEITMMAK